MRYANSKLDEVHAIDRECPIPAGEFVLNKSFDIPSQVPPVLLFNTRGTTEFTLKPRMRTGRRFNVQMLTSECDWFQ
jgi:hypothetical protein